MRYIVITITALLLHFYSLPVSAQEILEEQNVDFSQATDDQFKESQAFFTECIANETLGLQHDCRCLSAEFLTKRMILGDEASKENIMDLIRTTCLRDPDTPLPENRGEQQMKDFTDAELEEAQNIYAQCNGDTIMSTYMDCKCIAANFLDKRHEVGPLQSVEEILFYFRDSCKNATGIAGYTYSTCMRNSYITVPEKVEPRAFCECKARKFVELYMDDKGRVSQKLMQRVETHANNHCMLELTGRSY